jgi:ABC-type transport system substrate-binding protein
VVFAFYPEMSQIVSTASTVMAAASTTAAAAAPIAATAASSEAASLANVIAALQAISSWDPYLVYGGIALGVYKSSSSAIEAIYERSCLEVEKGREAKAGEKSSLVSNF